LNHHPPETGKAALVASLVVSLTLVDAILAYAFTVFGC
jgi:hypothetical protein